MKYPCGPFAAALIVNGYGDYDTIINGSFENLVMTWCCLAIASYEKEKLLKERADALKYRNNGYHF